MVLENFQDLAAVLNSIRDALDAHVGESCSPTVQSASSLSPNPMPTTLAGFADFWDMHAAICSILDAGQEATASTAQLCCGVDELQSRVPSLKKEVVELRG